jgi:hypothetical protein
VRGRELVGEVGLEWKPPPPPPPLNVLLSELPRFRGACSDCVSVTCDLPFKLESEF